MKRVLILAPFLRSDSRWLDDFCPHPELSFQKVPFAEDLSSSHDRAGATPLREWRRYDRYARAAMRSPCDAIVTCFPQLALVVAARLSLGRRGGPRLVAWNFNIGSLANRWKGHLAGRPLQRVDRFVVHARGEIGAYSEWLGIAPAKFRFVPLQSARVEPPPSTIARPYIVSMGSANRDYATLVAAVRGTGIRTVIIAGAPLLAGIPEERDVIRLHGLTPEQCHGILAGAELNVVPLASEHNASGQVTFTRSMQTGVATIATRCVGTVDYIDHGVTGLLVPPGDAGALRQAILSLWHDADLRAQIARAGQSYAERELSDEAAGRHLGEVLEEVLRA